METFPDGTPIDEWFYEVEIPCLERLGKQYNVLIAELCLQNSPFWTNHIYKCQRVKFMG